MEGSKARGMGTLALVILAIIAGANFFWRSDSEKSQSTKESSAATAIKQEIVALRSRTMSVSSPERPGPEIVLKAEFDLALRAEIAGDEQFAGKDYEAAKESYVLALGNFKKVLREFETHNAVQEPPDAVDNQDLAKQNPASMPTSMVTDAGIEEVTQQARQKEQKLLASAESQMIFDQNPPAFTREAAAPAAAARPVNNAGSIDAAAATNEVKRLKKEETRGKVEAGTDETSAAAPQIVAGEALDGEPQPANALDEATSAADRGVQPIAQEKDQLEDKAKREIATLIGAYQNSLAAKDLEGLKTLFRENFLSQHEKTWSEFFAHATNLRATVEEQDYRAGNSGSQVDLVVTISYSNRKGIEQKPLRFSEGWTLDRRDGYWAVATRRFE